MVWDLQMWLHAKNAYTNGKKNAHAILLLPMIHSIVRKGTRNMIRIWIYNKLEKYYKFCLHKWVDIYGDTKSDQALS